MSVVVTAVAPVNAEQYDAVGDRRAPRLVVALMARLYRAR
jgi:hypothetical protein